MEIEALRHFHFLRPGWFWLLPWLVLLMLVWRTRAQGSPWSSIIAPHLLKPLMLSQQGGARINPASMAVCLMLLAVLALAGPSWERRPSPFARDEAALVVALDVSSSMNQRDLQPSRLERGKHKISDLLDIRAGSRTGLLIFAGSAHSVIPLTDDADIMRNFLDAVASDVVPRAGKRADAVIPLADAMLAESGLPGSVLLLTDAASEAMITRFREYFAGSVNQLLVLGLGDPEAVQAVSRPLDESGLEALAIASGGQYVRVSIDDSDVRRIARLVDNHLVMADDSGRPWVDAGYLLCFPLTALFLMWFRKGWTVQWSVLLLLAGTLQAPEARAEWRFADLWATPDQQGMYFVRQGDYAEAARRFRDPLWQATALYLNEDFEQAADAFASLDGLAARFAEANARAHARQYVRARGLYQGVLALSARHEGALANLAAVERIIDEINRMSESQQAEPGDASRELGDEPQTGDGAERDDVMSVEQQYSADQLLNDPALNELWMRQIQQDPARFLSIKFQMQLRARSPMTEDQRHAP